MAVMVNPMGGSGDYRGPIYVKEVKTDTLGSFAELIRLQGPGRLLQLVGTRLNNCSYNVSAHDIRFRIIPDDDETRALYKYWADDNCNASTHLPVCPMLASVSFPEVLGSTDTPHIQDHFSLDYTKLKADRVIQYTPTWHGKGSVPAAMSFPPVVEGVGESGNDNTLTIYPDGLFFDDNLVISGIWNYNSSSANASYSFNGAVIVYQLFE